MIRRRVPFAAAAAAAALLLAGCAVGDTEAASDPTDGAVDGGEFSVALVTPSPLGDRSFIDSSASGARLAEDELGISLRIVESDGVAQQLSSLRTAVQSRPDLVLALGLDEETLLTVAEENPEQQFGVPSDIFVEELPDNVQAFTVDVHESSYLAGLVAGSLTRTGTVGAVLGGDFPGMHQFFYGYKQGVLDACADCTVEMTALGGNFSDPTLGKEAAMSLYNAGADILYAVAGLSGTGVLQAAAESGNYAIGVDSNQDAEEPGSVITSVMKRVDRTTYLLINEAMNGRFAGGEFTSVGLADGVSDLSWADGSTVFAENGPAELTGLLPEVEAAVEAAREEITDGSLVVCDALNDPASDECQAVGAPAA